MKLSKHIPILFTISGLVVLLALGTWQVHRLQWKTELVEKMNERMSMPAMDLAEMEGNFEGLKYRRVKLRGEFDHENEIYLFTGVKEFKGKAGYDILTPMKTTDGDVVLVDRGWVPSDMKARGARPDTLAKGVVEVEGMLHEGESKVRFVPENDLKDNLWFWIDMDAASKYTGYQMDNLYVRAIGDNADGEYPIVGDTVIRMRNDHLQYAITWYSLAIILVVIYVIYRRNNKGKGRREKG